MSGEYCELCGMEIASKPYNALVDGVEMTLCPSCYLKPQRSGRVTQGQAKEISERRKIKRREESRRQVYHYLESYELVENYGELIRRARQEKGIYLSELAQRLKISESMLRKIEQGKIKPTIDLAKRIEAVLKIKILVPSVDEGSITEMKPPSLTFGDVVVVRRDKDRFGR